MKNCIVQFHIDSNRYEKPDYNDLGVNAKLFEISVKSVKAYAKKINVAYEMISEPRINYIHPTFERFDLFENPAWFERYDNILYLDTDLVVWPDAPDIFSQYPDTTKFKVAEDRIAMKRTASWHENKVKDQRLNEFDGNTLQNNRFNAGVFMLNKQSASQMAPYCKYRELDMDDNCVLIYAMLKSGVQVEKMHWKYNKKNGTDCYFGHAYGQEKFKGNYGLLHKAEELFGA